MAMTLDGKIATARGRWSRFGSPADTAHLMELRSRADAILCGAETVRAEDANLSVSRGTRQPPLRVVVSGSARLDLRGRLFQAEGPIVVLTTSRAAASRVAALRKLGVVVHRSRGPQVNLPAAIRWLHSKWKIRRLHCEGGAMLNDALMRAGEVDEIHVTLCPWLVGGLESPTLSEGIGASSLKAMRRFRYHSVRQVENELFVVLRRVRDGA